MVRRGRGAVWSAAGEREREGEKGVLAFVTPAFMCDYLVYFKYNHIYTRTQTQKRRTHKHTHTHIFGHLVVFIGLTVFTAVVVVVFSTPADRTVAPTVAACAVVWPRTRTRTRPRLSPRPRLVRRIGFLFCATFFLHFIQFTHTLITSLMCVCVCVCHYSLCSLRSHLPWQYGLATKWTANDIPLDLSVRLSNLPPFPSRLPSSSSISATGTPIEC